MGLANINVRFSTNLAELSTQMQNASRQFKTFGEGLKSFGASMSLFATAPLVAAGTAAYSMAADFEDALGATDQIFKGAGDSVKQWAESLPTYFGIAQKEALEYSNMMGSMLVNIGNLTQQQASEQSAKLIELAGDLTAMYGGTTADAVRALTGSLKGNNTMLDNYGMAVNDAMVKTKALEMGLISQGQEMSLSAKQAATLALIYEQTGAAQGQAAREADGASGSMRTFKTELTNLGTQIGQQLLPIVTPLIQKLVEVTSSFGSLDPEVKKIIVVVGMVVAAIGPLALALGSVVSMIPAMITGFGAIGGVFTALTGPIGLVVAAIGGIIYLMVRNWDSVKKTLVDTANYWIDLYNESMLVRAAVQYIILIFKQFGNYISLVFNTATTIVKTFVRQIKSTFGNLGDLIKAILTGDFKAIPEIIGNQFKDSFKNVKGGLNELKQDFKTFGEDTKKSVSSALDKTFKDRKARITVETKTEKVEKEVAVSTEKGLNEGVEKFNTSGKSVKVKVEPIEGSVDWYNAEIKKIEEYRNSQKLTREEFLSYNKIIDEHKEKIKEISELNEKQSALKPIKLDLAGSQDYYNKQLENLRKLRDAAVIGTAEWLKLDNQIKDIEVKVKASVDTTTFENAKVAMQEIPYLFSPEQAEAEQEQISMMERLRATAEASSQGISGAFGAMSDFIGEKLGESTNLMDAFGAALIQNTIKAIGTALAQSTANAILTATSDSAKLPGFGTLALPALIGGAIAAVSTAFASVPKFANGGIVSGPTLGLMGEYAGAANNPEVIAPLNKLKDLIEPAGFGDINISLGAGLKISGSDLMLVLERAERFKNRKT